MEGFLTLSLVLVAAPALLAFGVYAELVARRRLRPRDGSRQRTG
jgi:hypothetical protein